MGIKLTHKFYRISLLLLIVLLAFALRIYRIEMVPPSLNWDEVSIAYNAYSVLQDGRDEWGQFLPLHFKAYGEYKLPAQIYASIPGVYLFGLTELGVRITPVVYGTLTVLLLYLLAYEVFKRHDIALVSAFLLAVSPWHIQLTRASFESSFSVFWVVGAVWLMIKGWERPKWLIFSTLLFVIGIYTYNSARIFIPIYMFICLLIYRKEFLKNKKYLLGAFVFFVALLLPLVPFTLSGEASDRYKLVSVLDDPGLVPRINEQRGLSTLPDPFPRLVHNKLTYAVYYFVGNYLAHFTPEFLFISGAPHKQHHVQGIGEMYFIQMPFILLGVYFLFRKKHKLKWLLVLWILLAFVPVSVTRDSIPHALRTVLAAPPYQMITAYGLVLGMNEISKLRNRRTLLLMVLAAFLISFLGYLKNYYNTYPYKYSEDWQYGYKQAVNYIKAHYGEYDKIVFTRHYGEPHMFTLFFMNWNPAKFRNDPNLDRFETFDWVRVLAFDKFYFPDLGDAGTTYQDIVSQSRDEKILFIGHPGDFPESAHKVSRVNFLDGDEAFEIISYNK